MTVDTRSRQPIISIVTPVYDEEMNIEPFYRELVANISQLDEFAWEIIFVDDGSTDRSVAEILRLRETDDRVKVLQLSRNFGSHPAMTAGLSYASGDAAVIMSVDLQDPANVIKDFLVEWRKGYHVVWGIRKSRKDPWGKRLLASIFYKFCRRVALKNFPEGGLDCSLFDRRVIDEFLKINERHAYLFASVLWMGFRQAYVPYDRRVRSAGVSKWPFAKRLKAAVDIIVSFSYFPIRFMSYLGITASVLSFIYAGALVIEAIFFGRAVAGWPSLMVAILFFGGVQLTMMGVLGEYIWRGTDQVKGRPRFLVMEEIGFDASHQGMPGTNNHDAKSVYSPTDAK